MPYVMVAVPAELVPQITELVAQYTGETPASDGPPLAVPTKPEALAQEAALIDEWTPQLLRRAYNESSDGMRGIFEYLAEQAGQEVTSTEIAENVDGMKDWNSVAGALGAFGRRAANRYGQKTQPWAWRYDADSRVLMKMPAAVAEVIKQVAAE
jgi:hypothetical protein